MTVDSKTKATPSDDEQESPPARRWPVHAIVVGAITGVFALIYSVFSYTMYYTARTAIYDLGIFYQAVKSYSEFKPGDSVAKGLHNFGAADFSVLGDHFSPIDAVLAPVIWIHDSPVDLLIVQGVLFALAIPFIWSFTRTAFGGGRWATVGAYCVSLAYALSWQIAGAAAFNFHEVAFAPVLTAIVLERLQKGKLKTALVAMIALLLVKEDMGFFMAGIGLCLILTRPLGIRRQKLTGLVLIVIGLIYSVVAVYWFIPAMGGRSDYYWAYGSLGPNAPSAVRQIIASPVFALKQLVTPRGKLHTELELFAPFLFLSLLSPYTLPAIPLILERFLASKYPNWWTNTFHYNAYLVVPIALGAVDGAVRLDKWVTWAWRSTTRRGTWGRKAGDWAIGRVGPAMGVLFLLTAIAFIPSFAFGQLLHSSFYHRNTDATAEAHAASLVPPGVVVASAGNVGPFLMPQDTVLVYDDDGNTSPYQPWVVGNDGHEGEFGFLTEQDEAKQLKLLIAHGYVIVWHDKTTGYFTAHAPNVTAAHPQGTPVLRGVPSYTARHEAP
ncbi:MAG TPA: DUF2079 domain-containing protein [Trebonia sp.]|nr:DUF2079 domain-containing protein [Trebonia sp.]